MSAAYAPHPNLPHHWSCAVTSLARLWQQQDKQHEARNTLSEIYGWFTEGFATKDLQEAKALLEALGDC